MVPMASSDLETDCPWKEKARNAQHAKALEARNIKPAKALDKKARHLDRCMKEQLAQDYVSTTFQGLIEAHFDVSPYTSLIPEVSGILSRPGNCIELAFAHLKQDYAETETYLKRKNKANQLARVTELRAWRVVIERRKDAVVTIRGIKLMTRGKMAIHVGEGRLRHALAMDLIGEYQLNSFQDLASAS